MTPFADPRVAAHFDAYPPAVRRRMLALRELVFATAARVAGVGPLHETLKWGEPAYVTAQTGSGSTVRIDWKRKAPQRYAMYFHCQTGLVDSFRSLFPNDFTFDGNRALVFSLDDKPPADALAVCIEASLTYHARRRASRREASSTAGSATMRRMAPAPNDVDAYIASFAPEVQRILRQVRATVRAAAPAAQEVISYKMPALKQHGVLVYYAAFKHHIGFYPPIRGEARLERAAARYAGDKGNLRFPLDEPIPYQLIERLTKLRARQDAAAAKARRR